MSQALAVLLVGVLVAGVLLLPAGRLERRAPADLLAVVRLLTIIALAVLPIALAVCAAALLSSSTHGGSSLDRATSTWLATTLYLLALALGLRLLWVAGRIIRSSRAAAVRGATARLAERIPLASGDFAYVLPVAEPLAYTAGLARGQVVVSRGLLDLLTREERRALLAHELAHLRGGHQRMLLIAKIVADALGFLPPVRRAFFSLRRQLEAAADAHAVAAVGDPRVVACTVAKTVLAESPVAVAPAGGGSDLCYRLERLRNPPDRSRAATAVAATSGALVAAMLVVSVCLAIHAGLLLGNVALCLAALGAVTLPPLVRRQRFGPLERASLV